MASVASDKNGTRRILFVAPDGPRRTIRLGKVSKRAAESIKYRVEQLLECLLLQQPMNPDLAKWVAELEPGLASKFARVGLISERTATGDVALGEHLERFITNRSDVKPRTLISWRQAQRVLLAFFGPNRRLSSITPGDAKDFARWLKTPEARSNRSAENSGLATNTIRKRISNTKLFFADAVAREILVRNPFASLKGTVGSNRDRDYFVSVEDTQRVLDACPDAQWRLMFALARFGGLRCPSEILSLRWGDVDWARSRLTVHAPKTEHHEGKGSRVIPIFPELRPHLEAVWELADAGTEFTITRYRDDGVNLRTQLQKIIARAGLTPWPKLWQNLRASRATELANEFPAHIAAAWMGHSTLIANKHYWQVTDDDYARAIVGGAAQNAAQQVHAQGRRDSQREREQVAEVPEMQDFATTCEISQFQLVGPEGLEPPTKGL